MLEVLRSVPKLQRLWLGSLLSGLGDSITWVALSWFVLEKTANNGGAVGLMLLCFSLPAILTGAPLGRLLDRFGAKPIMLIDNLARVVVIGLIPLLQSLGVLELWMIFGLAAVAGVLAPASSVGVRVILPQLVPDHKLEAGNAALTWTQQLPSVLGPILAGILVASWGAAQALWFDAASFAVFALLLTTLPSTPARVLEPTTHTGLKMLLAYPRVVVVSILSLAFFAAYGPLEAALPVYARTVLHTDAAGYGSLWSVGGVGILLGSLLVPALSKLRPGWVLPGITFFWGVLQLGIGLSSSLPWCMVWMFLACIIWGPYTALETSLIQRSVPGDQHGRIFGARASLMTPAAPLGTALGGAALGFMTSSMVIVVSAVLCILAGIVAFSFPALRRVPQRRD